MDKLTKIENFFDELAEAIDFYIKLRFRNIKTARVKDESNRTAMEEALERDKEVLYMLPDVASQYTSAIEFLDAIILDAAAGIKKDDGECLTLTTIHSVKGLEYDKVIILDCTDGVFPRNDVSQVGEFEEQEELRCFYVAITRARTVLIICLPLIFFFADCEWNQEIRPQLACLSKISFKWAASLRPHGDSSCGSRCR